MQVRTSNISWTTFVAPFPHPVVPGFQGLHRRPIYGYWKVFVQSSKPCGPGMGLTTSPFLSNTIYIQCIYNHICVCVCVCVGGLCMWMHVGVLSIFCRTRCLPFTACAACWHGECLYRYTGWEFVFLPKSAQFGGSFAGVVMSELQQTQIPIASPEP